MQRVVESSTQAALALFNVLRNVLLKIEDQWFFVCFFDIIFEDLSVKSRYLRISVVIELKKIYQK